MMTLQEIHTLKTAELHKELARSRQDLVKSQMGIRTRHEKDTSLAAKLKKEISQLQTVLRENALEEAVKNAPKI